MESLALTNVRVFDGRKLTDVRTIVLENGRISPRTVRGASDTVVDGRGATLLPGLIDSHVHLTGLDELKRASQWGVTTMLDMATQPPSLVDSLRGLPGLTDIRSSGSPASAPGSIQTTRLGFPISSCVTGPEDARRFVNDRVSEKVDYIKLVVEDPDKMGTAALTGATIAALVQESHQHGLQVFAHVTTVPAFQLAIQGGVDVVTHAPVDQPIPPDMVQVLTQKAIVAVPTMVMMRGVINHNLSMPSHGTMNFRYVEESVQRLHSAGITIIAGTDANTNTGSWFNVTHGESLHDELGLLVRAGLSPVEALCSATILPSQYLNLGDRGSIEPGKRADLLMVEGDPTKDISATRNIRGVWIAGLQVR